MSIFIAYPDGRIGREVKDFFRYVPDLQNRNRFQRIGQYDFMITKARDVPQAVERGCLFGLTGLDFLREYGSPELDIIEQIPFCKSRLVLFEPKVGAVFPMVVTVYPNMARKYLQERSLYGEPWELITVSGETESWVASGFADRGIDVVETGKTLEETGLVIKDVIMESSAVIIARKDNINKAREMYYQAKGFMSLSLEHGG